MSSPFDQPKTVWRRERAAEVAILVDGENYFRAVHTAILSARFEVRILGWDLNTKLRLRRGSDTPSDTPVELQETLNFALARNPDLHIYLLAWDYSWIYAKEREFLPTGMKRWASHPRLHFKLDGQVPLGCAHHQKVVVVDNALAFSGGFDLTSHRWDRRAHLPIDRERVNTDKKVYHPFHDAQMMVTGAAAEALGDLTRERWRTAHEELVVDKPHTQTPAVWPDGVPVHFTNVLVNISRTLPCLGPCAGIFEVEHSFVAMVLAAKTYIYIENQYFTSDAVGEALITSLQKPEGPEVVLVISQNSSGWLEELTMDVLRERWFEKLRASDRHHRLGIYHPVHGRTTITVHSKIWITDDRFLRVGSANLSNRSMAFDSECDLTIESDSVTDCAPNIRWHCVDLLAEHLDTPHESLTKTWQATGSLIATIEAHLKRNRTLLHDGDEVPMWLDHLYNSKVGGREEASRSAWFERHLFWLPAIRFRVLAGLGVCVLLVTFAFTLQPFATLGEVLNLWRDVGGQSEFSTFWVLICVALSFVVFPLWPLIFLTVLALPGPLGIMVAMIAILSAATANYWAARRFGRRILYRYWGIGLRDLSRDLGRDGLWGLVRLRLNPQNSFTLINLAAGATIFPFAKFFVGTALGLLPMVCAINLINLQLVTVALRSPLAPLVLAAAGLACLVYGLYRLKKRS